MICFYVMSVVKVTVDQVFTFAGLLDLSREVAQPMENMGLGLGNRSQSIPISAFSDMILLLALVCFLGLRTLVLSGQPACSHTGLS